MNRVTMTATIDIRAARRQSITAGRMTAMRLSAAMKKDIPKAAARR